MYYSKTPYSQNLSPNLYEQDQPNTLYTRLQQSESALSKALQNITTLQQNLSFMLSLNSRLQHQNQKLKSSQEKSTKTTNKLIDQHEKKYNQIKQQNLQIAQLLDQTKRELIDISTQLKTCQDELSVKQNIIREQKKAYMDLQFKFMNTSMSYLGDNSCLADNKDYQYIAELQKQNRSLQISVKRCEQLLEKEKNKSNKLEKEMGEFKQWMGTVLGIQKVIEGSQKILMKEIAQRVISC